MKLELVKDAALLEIVDATAERVMRLQAKQRTHQEQMALGISQRELIRYRAELTRRAVAAGRGNS